MISKKHRASITAALVLPALMLGACSAKDDSTTSTNTDAPKANTEVSGSIVISGSSTVEPITALVAEEFMAQNSNVDITVDGPGTGDGFELFCNGETAISDASRPIKEEEIAACEEKGIEFIELKVGIDGLSVITSEDNEVECLSFQDLYALVGPESEGFSKWTDAQELAAELGSKTTFPDNNLVVTAPGAESGTFDSFVELVIEAAGEARVEAGKITEDEVASARDDYSASPDDNAIIEGVTFDPGGLGWVGFAFADQAEGVKLMPVSEEANGECVAPTAETIQDGSYPISRSLYIYVNKAQAEENKGLGAFVDFYLEGLSGFVESADYIALADDAETIATWENRTVGTREG
ncbi:MAG: phosphate ABC transporter substrate-binding protein PstS family protein [Acidimicrobiales bacterium]|nr:phosphate ABC transporter substrate-binding protein PstS family protein [Acidimicrobiales bacterium]